MNVAVAPANIAPQMARKSGTVNRKAPAVMAGTSIGKITGVVACNNAVVVSHCHAAIYVYVMTIMTAKPRY